VLPTGDDVRRLRDVLAAHGYTADAVLALLGSQAHAALNRGDHVPALRATRGGSPLETLVRLFLLGTTEPDGAGLPEAFLERTGDRVRAVLDVRPYAADDAHWWVVSDLGTDVRPPPLRPDHVLGIGGASLTLAQATVREPVATALDVGTGCGIQALHLSTHAGAVTATDRNPRALALARMTALLNGVTWELLDGDLLAPVERRRYDLVVANPPFVVGPARDDWAYRDSGVAGDAISERLVRGVPGVLADGGTATLLANWLHVDGADWRERVASWVPAGVDALVLQRETQDPAEYVALWQRDAGDERRATAEEWLAWFERETVAAVGFGIVTLRRTGGAASVTVEDAPQPVVQPLGPHLAAWLARAETLRGTDLLDAAPRVAGGVTLEQVAFAGAEGWEVAAQALQQSHGLRWRAELDPVGVALVGACDGTRRLRDLLDVLATAYEVDREALTGGALAAVRHLVGRGFLEV
jgi:methylase of polypeptide subunit release factors